MTIGNQDKTGTTNFDNINTLRATKTGEIMSFDNSYRSSDNCSDVLGTYDTEERAKEVLKEMLKQKAMFELYKLAPTEGEVQTEMLDKFVQKNIIFDTYEMPEK